MCLLRSLSCLFRIKIHIRKTGCTASDHFSHRQLGAVAYKILINPLIFCRPDMVVEPVLKRLVVSITPKQAHSRVSMGINQAWGNQMIGKIDGLLSVKAFVRFFLGNDSQNFSVMNSDSTVFQYTIFGYDWNNPARLNQ